MCKFSKSPAVIGNLVSSIIRDFVRKYYTVAHILPRASAQIIQKSADMAVTIVN